MSRISISTNRFEVVCGSYSSSGPKTGMGNLLMAKSVGRAKEQYVWGNIKYCKVRFRAIGNFL